MAQIEPGTCQVSVKLLYSAAQKKVLGLLHVLLQVLIDRFLKNP